MLLDRVTGTPLKYNPSHIFLNDGEPVDLR